MPGEDFLSKYLPLILTGGSIAGNVIGSKVQAGAIDKSAELQAQSAQKQLDALLGMYQTQRNDLAPYRAAGTNALANIQGWKPNDPNRHLSKVDFSTFKPPPMSPALSKLSSTGGNAFSPEAPPPSFGDISTKGIHSRGQGALSGALGGFGAGLAGKTALNAFAGPALSAALGPATLGIAPAVGAIKGALFDNDNADSSFATKGIQRVSDWTWKSLVPAVKAGQISPDDAQAQFENVWSQWQDSMKNTPGFNKDVLNQSITSQRQYFQPFFTTLDEIRRQPPQQAVG